MSDIETFSFTGRQVQEIVSGCYKLEASLNIAMRRVRGFHKDADLKRAAIRERQAEVAAIITMLCAPMRERAVATLTPKGQS